MHPSTSSSSDPNAAYRTKTPELIDFFANERIEQQEIVNANHQQTAFSGLSPRSEAHSAAINATTEVAEPATNTEVSLYTIQRYLRHNGYAHENFLRYKVTQNRLDSANLSAKTLLDAIKIIVEGANQPLLTGLGVSNQESIELIYRLAGITTNSAGFRPPMRAAVQNANNNPEQLIAAILQHIRNLKP